MLSGLDAPEGKKEADEAADAIASMAVKSDATEESSEKKEEATADTA